MAKLHFVERASKNYLDQGIRKGESYYWWYGPRPRAKGSRGIRIFSKTKPRRSALSNSEFVKGMLDCEDDLQVCGGTDEIREIAERVREIGAECQEKKDAMESRFPNGCPTLDLLEERIQACVDIAEQIDDAADSVETTDFGLEVSDADKIELEIRSINWEYS